MILLRGRERRPAGAARIEHVDNNSACVCIHIYVYIHTHT